MPRKIEGRDDIVAWVQEYIDAGMQPHEACRKAFEEAIGGRMAASVLRALGWQYAFYEPWMAYNRLDRKVLADPDDPAPQIVRPEPGAPVGRAVDLALVRERESLYTKLVSVGRHKWVPLGELTKAMCKTVAAGYRTRAAANAAVAEIFDTLDNGLEDEQTTVKERFSEAELEALWRRKAA